MQVQEALESIGAAASYIRSKTSVSPRIAVVLGSGLSDACPALENAAELAYADIPGFPRTTVKGHNGRLIVGELGGSGVAVLQGRFHYFEGHPMSVVALPLRVMARLGAKTAVLTSAVGSMRPTLKPGNIVVLKDHINLMGHNPLRGFHGPDFGEMFPDMSAAYSPGLRKKALAECRRLKIPAREGVYTAVGGPSYETPAEIRAFRRLGGDVVGMSTVPEVIVARQMGLEVLVMSWVSNMAAGISKTALAHAEVLDLGRRMSVRLRGVLDALLRRI